MPSLKNLNDFKQITEEKVKKDGYAPWQKATSQSVVSSDLVSAKPAFRYDDSDLGYVTTRDNENLYADYQSPLESFGKGITKFVGDVAIGIVGNLSAIPVGIGSAIVNGDATKLFDNDYTAALDAASESLSEALPFYYSSNYADKNLFQRMGTANFWWDKVLGGASFTVSAIASEAIASALTGATFGAATPALVGTTARVISRANKIFKAADTAIDATKGAARGFRMAEEAFQVGQAGIRAAGDVATTATAWNRIGTFARQQMFGTMYEASVEARHHANELREALIEEHRNRYGTDPTEQDMQDIEREVASSGTASFLSNVALLSASNMAMYKNFGYGVKDLIGKRLGMAKVGLAPGRGVAKGAIKEVEETVAKTAAQTAEKELAEGVVEGAAKEVGKDVTYKAAYDTWSGLRKGLDRTWTIAKQPLTEGLEEGMQSIISNTLKDYHMHKYNPESLHETASIVDSFGKALKQQYSFGNADAWEENFIGMFLGGVGLPTITTRYNAEGKQERGFGMAGGIFQEMKDRNIEIQRQRDHAEFLNKTKLDSVEVVKKTMQNAIEMHSLTQEQKKQMEEGNFKGAKDTEANMAFSFFKARHDTGRFESVLDNVVSDINNMTTDQFAEQFGYTNLTKEELEQRKSKVVDSFIKEANDVRDSIREVDRIAPTVSESIRTGLAHTLYRTRNSERRYNEIIEEVSSMLNGTVDAKKVQEAYSLITQEYDLSDKRYKSNKEKLAKLKTLSEKLQQLETPDPSLTVEQSIARNKEIKQTLDAIADTFEKVKMDKNNTIAVRNVAETLNELVKFENETNEAARQKLPASVSQKMQELSGDLNALVQDKATLTSLYNYLFTKNGKENWDKITDELQKLMILSQSPEGQEKLTSAQMRKLEAAIAGSELSDLGKKLNLGILKDEAEIQIAKAKDTKEKKTKKKLDAEAKVKEALTKTVDDIETKLSGIDGDVLKGSAKTVFNKISTIISQFNKDALLITSSQDLKELTTLKEQLEKGLLDIEEELKKNTDPDSKKSLNDLKDNVKDLVSAINTSLKTYTDKTFIRGSATTPYREQFSNLKRSFTSKEGDSQELKDYFSNLQKELFKGNVTNEMIQEGLANGKLTITTVKSPLPNKPITYSDRKLQYTPYPVLAKVYLEINGKKEYLGNLDAAPVNLKALDKNDVDAPIDWFRSIPGVMEQQMNLINPNYVTGKKLNDKGELLVKQAQSMIAFFNNVIDGQEGLEISSEEIAKYFTVGKGDFTYLTNDIRPSVKEYLLGNPGAFFDRIKVITKDESGVEKIEEKSGVLFYDGPKGFILIGADGKQYKIEGKQQKEIWERYHKENDAITAILKYNTFYVLYKKPDGNVGASAVELSKPVETVEDTAERFDNFLSQILNIDIGGEKTEDITFSGATTEQSKKGEFTIVNKDESFYAFRDFNKDKARNISADFANTTFGNTEDGQLFIPLRNKKGVKDSSAEEGFTKRSVEIRVRKKIEKSTSVDVVTGKKKTSYNGKVNIEFEVLDKNSQIKHTVYFSINNSSLIKDPVTGNVTGIKKDADGNFSVRDHINGKNVNVKDIYDLINMFNNVTGNMMPKQNESVFKDFGNYEINIDKNRPDTSGFRILSKSPESMLMRVSSDGAIKFTPRGDAPIVRSKPKAPTTKSPAPGTPTPTTGKKGSPELNKKVEDFLNNEFVIVKESDLNVFFASYKNILDKALADGVIEKPFYDEKVNAMNNTKPSILAELQKNIALMSAFKVTEKDGTKRSLEYEGGNEDIQNYINAVKNLVKDFASVEEVGAAPTGTPSSSTEETIDDYTIKFENNLWKVYDSKGELLEEFNTREDALLGVRKIQVLIPLVKQVELITPRIEELVSNGVNEKDAKEQALLELPADNRQQLISNITKILDFDEFDNSQKEELKSFLKILSEKPDDSDPFADIPITGNDNDGGAVFSFTKNTNPNADIVSLEEAINNIREFLPESIQVADINTILDRLSSQNIPAGVFLNNVIYLNNTDRSNTTEYHEAFHAVIRVLATDQEIDMMFSLATKLYPQPTYDDLDALVLEDPQGRKDLNEEQLIILYYEEKLANDFGNYVAKKKGIAPENKENETLKTYFEGLKQKVEAFQSGADQYREQLESIFDYILDGNFKTREVRDTPHPFFLGSTDVAMNQLLKFNAKTETNQKRVQYLSTIESNRLISQTLNRVLSNSVMDNYSINDIAEEDIWNAFQQVIEEQYNPNAYRNASFVQSKSKAEQQEIAKKLYRIRLALFDIDGTTIDEINRQAITKEVMSRLEYYSAIDQDIENEDDSKQDESGDQLGAKEGYTVGGFGSAPAFMRFYMSSIDIYEDIFGIGVDMDSLSDDEKGLFKSTANGFRIYTGLTNRLCDLKKNQFLPALLRMTNNPAVTAFKNKFIQDVVEQYNRATNNSINPQDIILLTNPEEIDMYHNEFSKHSNLYNMFTRTFKLNRINPRTVIYDPKGESDTSGKYSNVRIGRSNLRGADSAQVEGWANNWLTIKKDLTGKNITDILNSIQSNLSNRIYTDANDLNFAIYEIIDDFKKLGIELHPDYVAYSVISNKLATYQDMASNATTFEEKQTASYFVQYVESVSSFVYPLSGDDIDGLKTMVGLQKGSVKELFGKYSVSTEDLLTDEKIQRADSMTRLLKIASGNAVFDETVLDSNFRNADGETVYDKTQSNYITNKIKSLGSRRMVSLFRAFANNHIDFDLFTNQLFDYYKNEGFVTDDDYYEVLAIARNLANNPLLGNIASNLDVYFIDGLVTQKLIKNEDTNELETVGVDRNGATYGSLSVRDKTLFNLITFLNTVPGEKVDGVKKEMYYQNIGVESDKNTHFMVQFERNDYSSKGKPSALAIQHFGMHLQNELARINNVTSESNDLFNYRVSGYNNAPEWIQKSNIYMGYEDYHYIRKNGVDYYITSNGIQGIDRQGNVVSANGSGITENSFRSLNYFNFKPGPYNSTKVKTFLQDQLEKARTTDNVKFEFTKEENALLEEMINEQFESYLKDLSKPKFGVLRRSPRTGEYISKGLLPAQYVKYNTVKEGDTSVEEANINRDLLMDAFLNYQLNNMSFSPFIRGEDTLRNSNIQNAIKREAKNNASGSDEGNGVTKIAIVDETIEELDSTEETGVRQSGTSDRTDGQGISKMDWLFTHLRAHGKLDDRVKSIHRKHELGIVDGNNLSDSELDYLESRGALAQTLKLVYGGQSKYIKFALTFLDRRNVSRLRNDLPVDVKSIVRNLIELKHFIQDNDGTINNSQFNEVAQELFPEESFLTVQDVELALQNYFEPIEGREYQHNMLNSMETTGTDWTVHKSGSKEANKDVGFYDEVNGVWNLFPSEFSNSYIREQVVTENLKTEGIDGTQKLQLLGYEQYEEALTYFNKNTSTVGMIKDAHAKMLAHRVNLGYQQVKNMILNKDGEAQWKFLMDSFKDNIRAAGGDPLLEEFTEMNGIKPLYDTNYTYIESRFQSAFLNFVSKEVLKHKSAQAKFTLVSDKGMNVARSIYFYDDNVTIDDYRLAREVLGKVDRDGQVDPSKLSDEQTKMYEVINALEGDTFEQKYLGWYVENVNEDVIKRSKLADKSGVDYVTETSRLRHRMMDTDGKYYSECIVSEWFLKQYGLKVGDRIPTKLLKMLGVRIPTQDNHSMVSLKIVDFTPAIHGNNIIVPFEVMILSGGDFDIDALYSRIYKTLAKGSTEIYGDYLNEKVQTVGDESTQYYNVIKRAKKEMISSVRSSYMFKKLMTNYFEENKSPLIDELNELLRDLNTKVSIIESDPTSIESIKHQLKVNAYKDIIDSLPPSVKNRIFAGRAILGMAKKSRFVNLINDTYILNDILENLNEYIKEQDDEEFTKATLVEALNDLKGIFEDLDYNESSFDYMFNVVKEAKDYIDYVGGITFAKVTGFHPDYFEDYMRERVIQNKKNFDAGQYNEIVPLTTEESENLLLDMEINLLHNSGNKDISGSPATIEEFDNLTNLLNRNGITTGPQIFTQHGLGDQLRLTEDIDAGKKNIGIAAISNTKGNLIADNDFKLDVSILGSQSMSGYFVQGTRIRKNDLKSTVITGMTDNTKKSVAGTYNLNDKSIGAFGAILDANISFEQAGLLFKQPVIEIAAATLEQQSTRSVIKSRSEKSLESKKLKGMFKSDLQNVVLDAILEDGDNIDDLGSMNVPLNRNNLLAAIYYGQQLENGTLDTSNEVTIVEINQSGLDNIVSSKTNPEEFKKLYKAIQVRSLNEFLKAKEINDVLFPLGSIMSLIKGLPNTFADVQIILNDLEKLGIRYTITGDYTNPNNIAFEAVGSSITDLMYAGASDNRENPVFVAIMNTPLIVQNLKTTIALNEASKNHFLMNTGTGKYLLSTLVNSATRKMNAEVLGELRSQALSFIGVASLRKALSDMIVKDPSIADRIMFHMEENDSQNPNLPYIFDVNQLFFGEIFQGDDSSTKVDRYEKALRSNVGRNNKLLKSLVLTATSYTRNPNSVFAGRKVVRFTGNTIPKRNQDYLLELVNNFEELVQTSGTSATHAISKDLFNQSLLRDNFRYTRDSVLKHISPKFMASYMRALKKVHDTFLNKLDNTTDQKERDKLFIDLFGFPEVVFLNELQQNVFRGAKNADVRIMAYNPLKKVGSKSLHVKMLTQLAKMDKLPEMKQEDAKQDLSDANNKVSDKQAVYPFKQKGEQNRELADGITVNDIPLRAFTSEVNGETVSYMVLDQFAGLSKFTDKEKRSLVFKENLKLLRSSGLTKIETWPTPDGAYHSAMALPLVFSVVSYTPDGRPVTRTYKLVKFVPSIADSKGKKKTVIWSPVTGIGDLSEGKKKMLQNKSDSMEFEVYASGRLKGELMFSEQDIAEQSKKDLKDTIDYTNDRLMQTLGSSNLPLGTSAVYVETFEFGSKEVGPHAATVAQWEDMWNNRDTSTSEGFQNADSLEESLARYNESLAMASGGEFEYVRAKQQYTEDELAAMVQQAMFGTPLTEENTTCKTSKK